MLMMVETVRALESLYIVQKPMRVINWVGEAILGCSNVYTGKQTISLLQ